mmetsp:Transcript_123679/g.311498  ORF Transcript_123679/g.311498 Transcript_123679/m.311498 type:complete len:273 (-) Transcript_123679:417-1235(-)
MKTLPHTHFLDSWTSDMALRWKSKWDFAFASFGISARTSQISLPRRCARIAASSSVMSIIMSPESSSNLMSALQVLRGIIRPALANTQTISSASSCSSFVLRYDGLYVGWRKISATRNCFSFKRFEILSKRSAGSISSSSPSLSITVDLVDILPTFDPTEPFESIRSEFSVTLFFVFIPFGQVGASPVVLPPLMPPRVPVRSACCVCVCGCCGCTCLESTSWKAPCHACASDSVTARNRTSLPPDWNEISRLLESKDRKSMSRTPVVSRTWL